MRSVGSFSFAWSSHSLTEASAAFGSACVSTSPKSLKNNPASGNALRSAITPGTRIPHLANRYSSVGRFCVPNGGFMYGPKAFRVSGRVSAMRAAVMLCGCALPLLTTACASNQQERFGWQFGSTSFEPVGSIAPSTTSTSEAYDAPASVSGDPSTEPSRATEWRTYVYPAAMFAYRGDSR